MSEWSGRLRGCGRLRRCARLPGYHDGKERLGEGKAEEDMKEGGREVGRDNKDGAKKDGEMGREKDEKTERNSGRIERMEDTKKEKKGKPKTKIIYKDRISNSRGKDRREE